MGAQTNVAESVSDPTVIPLNPSFQSPLTVIALPLPERPLCPGFYLPIYVKDPKLLAALLDIRYVGAFLLKDGTTTSLDELKGKDLLNQLHEIGSLTRITSIQGHQVILTGHTRIRITHMVSEDPVTVKFDYLKDKPYDKYDDVIKAKFFEVSSLLRAVLKTNSVWRDHVQHIGNFNYSYLADFGAAIPCAKKHQAQQIIQELDVHKRLHLTLILTRKEMQIIKIEGLGLERNYNVLSFPPVVYEETPVGVAMALSWRPTGGLAWYMLTTLVEEGEAIGCLDVTGQVIGEDTKESVRIAYIVAQQILLQKQPKSTFFANSKLCLHLPNSKGASAGCAMVTSLLSLAMNKPVKRDLAMTGAVTLTGKILPIGGVKEKTIGARRNLVKTIILPKANKRHFEELTEVEKEGIDVHYVDEYEQIFELAFGYDHSKKPFIL